MSVRLQFDDMKAELLPGRPFEMHGWTELAYSVYCFVAPPPLAEISARRV
jgi:hypothetical protein